MRRGVSGAGCGVALASRCVVSSPDSEVGVPLGVSWDSRLAVGDDDVLSGAMLNRVKFAMELGATAKEWPVSDIESANAGDRVVSDRLVANVNFSIEFGANRSESGEINGGTCRARARTNGSGAALRLAGSRTVLAPAKCEPGCLLGAASEATAVVRRTADTRRCGLGFDRFALLLAFPPCFRREIFRWSFRPCFPTGERAGETCGAPLVSRAETVVSAAPAAPAQKGGPRNSASAHAVEMWKLWLMQFYEQRTYRAPRDRPLCRQYRGETAARRSPSEDGALRF